MAVLSLERLKEGLPGITPALGAVHAEACLICLEKHQFNSGIEIKVQGEYDTAFNLAWEDNVTPQMAQAWNDLDEATEFAACGIAFLLVLALTHYTVIQRSRKGTGFDYWLADRHTNEFLPFQYAARLEVSGIFNADYDSIINARVRQKMDQVSGSNHVLPAYVIVVEFSRPLAQVQKSWRSFLK